MLDTRVRWIKHDNSRVISVLAENCRNVHDISGNDFISSIPLTACVNMLSPAAPDDILDAASKLKYRDLVIVTVMLDRQRVSDLTWIYLPEKSIPIGRIHEPRNWSTRMAPEGKTHLVCEYFCFKEDDIWNAGDDELHALTVKSLEYLSFITRGEVMGSCVVRVPAAYPLFEVGYAEYYDRILRYLSTFENLHLSGRNGMFRYYNMDYAIESGIEAAEKIIRKPYSDSLRVSSSTEA